MGSSSIKNSLFHSPNKSLLLLTGMFSEELKNRAITYLEEKEEEFEKERKELGVEDSLKSLEILDLETLVLLGRNNIKTKDDLADLSSDELLEIVGDKIQHIEEANKIIMKAREDWFNDIS